MKVIGRKLPHESAAEHVTGRAQYIDDIAQQLPNVLHAWPITAPYAHALLTALEIDQAMAEPGVVTCLTAADVPGEGDTGYMRRDEPLFPTEIMYHSQPIAWVLGETAEAARRGAARVRPSYAPLPAILTIEEAIAAESFHDRPFRIFDPSTISAIETGPHRLEGRLYIGGQEHFYLETQAALARLDGLGGIIIEAATQHPSGTQEVVARVLGLPRSSVVVECLRLGGGFGGKEVQASPWAAVAALGAWKTRRPVVVRLPRRLDMALTGKRHPVLARYVVGFESDGRLRGLQLRMYADSGWSLDLSAPMVRGALLHCDNCYLLPAVDLSASIMKTHKTSQTACRGFGAPQGMVVIEDILDRIARELNVSPDLVRARNFYREGAETHYGQPVKGAGRIDRIWRELKESSLFDARREEIAYSNADSRDTKRGLAIVPVKLGISFTAGTLNQAGALVLVYRDGSVQVSHGGTEMGQGLNTKIRQIAAETLGVDINHVRVMPTRTDKVPNTSPTAASTGTDLNGGAVVNACLQIVDRMRPVAAEALGCADDDVRFFDNAALGTDNRIAFEDLTEIAYRRRIPLFAHGFYATPDISFDIDTGRGKPFHYFAYGAAVAEVEVDRFTGMYRVLRVDVLEDVGETISPLIDLGQIEGGFVQGMGWLTTEELVWDAQGRLVTEGTFTYKIPSSEDVPPIFNVSFLERAAEPGVVFGSKAVGEPPLMLAISVREAIRDAIAAFGEGSPVLVDSPLTPERVFWAVEEARGNQA